MCWGIVSKLVHRYSHAVRSQFIGLLEWNPRFMTLA
jgi:hypothetical protein